jgi:hypothetical protein
MTRQLLASFAVALVAGVGLGHEPQAPAGDAGWGTIKGRIVWGEEELPPVQVIDVTKDKEHCLAKGPIHSEEWVVNKDNKGVRWTFVWLTTEDPKTHKLPIHPVLQKVNGKEAMMDQPCCMFVPHVLGIREGQDVLVKNSAPVAHNVNWSGNPLKNIPGNVLIPAGGSHRITGLKADRLPLKVQCNIHPWMNAWLGVFDHPYFAVADADGRFEIKQAPAGTYRLVVWHGSVGYREGASGRKGMAVVIKDGKVTDLGELSLKSKYE